MAKLEFDPSSSLPDLKGKVAIVTGGNAGIGYETVKRLAMKGAKVYMGARNASRAAAAIAQLKAEGALGGAGGGQVEWLHLDLIVPSTTRDGAEDFLKRENRLDILVNNAGVLGFADDLNLVHARIAVSEIMSINHLGPFVLTTTLLPLLKKTAAEAGSDVRIITLSSSSHYESWLHGVQTTKGLNVLFAKELQRKLDEEHIPALSMAVDPGIVDTPTNRKVVASQRWFGWLFLPYINIRSMPVAKGAYTTLFAAASPVVKDRKKEFAGAYLKPLGVIATPKKETLDPVIARDLWETSERAVAAM
ncbi:hypothetical protein FRB95_005119 [Tulasnella sp. JGI-2019a]|nr:hypothetical protein FRB95_005119 [Tulasnella sp. JGI-2019a]